MADIGAVSASSAGHSFAQQPATHGGVSGSESLPPLLELEQPVTALPTEQGLQQPVPVGHPFLRSATALVGEFQQWPDVEKVTEGLTEFWRRDGVGSQNVSVGVGDYSRNPQSQPLWVVDGVKLDAPDRHWQSVSSPDRQRKLLSSITDAARAAADIGVRGGEVSLWTARFSLLTSLIGNVVKGIGTLFRSGGG